MTKQEIEDYVLKSYPVYIDMLKNLENGLNKGLNWYIEEYPDLCKQGDFRPGTIARFLSCSSLTRFHFTRTKEYIERPDWDKDFINNYALDPAKEHGYLGNFKDIDNSIRLNLFHLFYHQLETTIRILLTKLDLPKNREKPLIKINNLVNCFPSEFITFMDALRNTIHNNGYYLPNAKNQPDIVIYSNGDLDVEFKAGEKTALNTFQTILVAYEVSQYTECLLKNENIMSIEFTPDRN